MTRHGFTLLELVATVAVAGILAAVAVPGLAGLRGALAADTAARRLTLVLRCAQATAQAHGTVVLVSVAPGGSYAVAEGGPGGDPQETGELGLPVATNYPGGDLAFDPRGWAGLPGAGTPRAGSFVVGGPFGRRTVVVQLSGCVRCR